MGLGRHAEIIVERCALLTHPVLRVLPNADLFGVIELLVDRDYRLR